MLKLWFEIRHYRLWDKELDLLKSVVHEIVLECLKVLTGCILKELTEEHMFALMLDAIFFKLMKQF